MNSENQFTLRDFLKILFRHKLVLVSVFVVLMTATYIGLELRIPRYEAQVRMLVTGSMQKDVEYLRDFAGNLTETQSLLVLSKPVIERTVRALRLDQRPLDYHKRFASDLNKIMINYEVKQLRNELKSLSTDEKNRFLMNRAMGMLLGNMSQTHMGSGSSIFLIGYTDYNPKDAAIIANVLSRAYVIFDIEQQIAELELTYGEKNPTVIKLKNHIKKLEDYLDGRPLPDIEAIGPASVKIVGQATFGRKLPQRPTKTSALMIAFLLSLSLGGVLAYVFNYFDQTFKSRQEVESFLNIPVLGSIPEIKSKDKLIIDDSNLHTDYAKSLHEISEQIFMLIKNKNLKSLLITNVEGLKENEVIVANIGSYLAHKAGIKVLIIDTNVTATTTIPQLYKIPKQAGLTNIIQGKASFEDVIQDLGANLYMLSPGNGVINPVSLIEASEISDVIKKAEEQFDIVIMNGADLRNFKDAVTLSLCAGGIVLAISEGKVRRQVVKNIIGPIEKQNSNIIGAILCNRKYFIPEIIYKNT